MNNENLFGLLRRWLWLIVLVAVAAGAAGYVVADGRPTEYTSSSTVLVGPIAGDNDTVKAASALTPTYAELATSGETIDAIAVAFRMSHHDVAKAISVANNIDTRIVTVSGTADTRRLAQRLVDAVTAELKRLGDTTVTPSGKVRVITAATDSGSPASNHSILYGILAALLAAAASAGVALMVESRRKVLRSDQELMEISGLPVLTHLEVRRRGRLTATEDRPMQAAAFRLLSAYVTPQLTGERYIITVADATRTSSSVQVAGGLALAFEKQGYAVAFIDLANDQQTRAMLSNHGSPESVINALARDAAVVVCAAGSLVRDENVLQWLTLSDQALLVTPGLDTRPQELRTAAETTRLTGVNVVGLVVLGHWEMTGDESMYTAALLPRASESGMRERGLSGDGR